VGFDALINFKPFSFRADFGAGVALRKGTSRWATIHVSGVLSGTNPWHVQGSASLSLFLFSISVSFNVDLSRKQEEPIEGLPDILALLATQIESLKSWSTEMPPAGHQLVTLAANQTGGDGPVLDPLGAASVKQRLLPLDQKIDRFEHQKLPKQGPNRFRITKLTLRPDAPTGSEELTTFPAVTDQFARGQFVDMTDAAKLSLPAFEQMTAGAKVGTDALAVGVRVGKTNDYDTILIEGPDLPDATLPGDKYAPSAELTAKLARRGSAALGGLRTMGPEKFFAGFGSKAKTFLGAERFTLATIGGLDPKDSLLDEVRTRIGFITKGKAQDFLQEYVAQNPDQRGQLQVVPLIEIPEAA
jgi:hypothetical protein